MLLVLLGVISEMRSQSNAERLPVFETLARSKAIRLPLKPRIGNGPVPSRQLRGALGSSEYLDSSCSVNAMPNLKVIFTVHIDKTPDIFDLQSLVG